MNISTIISAVLTIATIFSMPVYASTYQATINTSGISRMPAQFTNYIYQASGDDYIVSGGRSALGHRLMLDMRTNDASTISLDNGGDVILQRSLNGVNKSQSLAVRQASGTVTAPKYFITDLGTLGGTQSFAYGINDSGQVVGYSWLTGDAGGDSFLYSNGKMISLFPLNSHSQGILTVGPTGINNRGQIASGIVNNGIYYPAIFDIKTREITTLGSLGGVTSYGFNGVATSINNLGQAVGYSYIDNVNRHAFLYSDGMMTDIGSFGGYSGANAINNEGIIVGFSSDRYNGRAHAFLYTNGVMTDLDPFGDSDFSSSESYAYDVNNLGQVVGEFLTADQSAFHAFLYSEGVFTDLGSAGSPETAAFAINNQGQVVGTTLIPYDDVCFDYDFGKYVPCIKYKQHAFIYENGNITDMNTLIPPGSGWELTWALDINNHGQIVGYGLVNDKFRAFLLTPISEPCDRIKITRLTATPSVLWPPNHKLVPVSVTVSAHDSCGAVPICEIVSVRSNEPISSADWERTGNLLVQLRAEREGKGNGRVYTLTVRCANDVDSAMGEVTVTVPHDQGKGGNK